MTEESFQRARKLMQQLNYLRGQITEAKARVGTWTRIEDICARDGKDTAKAKQMIDRAMRRLAELRALFAAIVFPPHDLQTPKSAVNYCRVCQTQIPVNDQYCYDCNQNSNLPKYDFKHENNKDVY
jgi:hypothetical protein